MFRSVRHVVAVLLVGVFVIASLASRITCLRTTTQCDMPCCASSDNTAIEEVPLCCVIKAARLSIETVPREQLVGPLALVERMHVRVTIPDAPLSELPRRPLPVAALYQTKCALLL